MSVRPGALSPSHRAVDAGGRQAPCQGAGFAHPSMLQPNGYAKGRPVQAPDPSLPSLPSLLVGRARESALRREGCSVKRALCRDPDDRSETYVLSLIVKMERVSLPDRERPRGRLSRGRRASGLSRATSVVSVHLRARARRGMRGPLIPGWRRGQACIPYFASAGAGARFSARSHLGLRSSPPRGRPIRLHARPTVDQAPSRP